jgi:hypothetical protein
MLLPRAKEVKSSFNPVKMNWLDAIGKLSEGRFSGYLHCWGSAGDGIILFVGGRLAAVRFFSETVDLRDGEALERIFSLSLTGKLTLAIYRMSQELGLQVYAVFCGETLYSGQQLHLLDIPHLLGKLGMDRFTGCLRVGAGRDLSLIFYSEGKPLGFFLDGSAELTREAELEKSVARLPGAFIDIIAGQQDFETELPDLLQSHDVAGLWNRALEELKAAG